MQQHQDVMVGTLVYPIDVAMAANPNVVKVVRDHKGFAMYFSRAAIPFIRDTHNTPNFEYMGHIGIYAYRRSFLLNYSSLEPSLLEKIEKLEQLRVLENGYKILTAVTNYRAKGIDTPDDYRDFVSRFQ